MLGIELRLLTCKANALPMVLWLRPLHSLLYIPDNLTSCWRGERRGAFPWSLLTHIYNLILATRL